jgi:hypothetical protein
MVQLDSQEKQEMDKQGDHPDELRTLCVMHLAP